MSNTHFECSLGILRTLVTIIPIINWDTFYTHANPHQMEEQHQLLREFETVNCKIGSLVHVCNVSDIHNEFVNLNLNNSIH